MTDDEVCYRLDSLRIDCDRDPNLEAALAHALQAIKDRAALVPCVDDMRSHLGFEEWPRTCGAADRALDAARRHMEGKP